MSKKTGCASLTFIREAAKEPTLGPLIGALLNYEFRTGKLAAAFEQATLLDHVMEGHWKIASDQMKRALATRWFDSKRRFFCDEPLQNLMVNSLFGIYAHPWFLNPRQTVRLKYRAKETTMFADCLLLDQCRYYFDFLPTIDLIPSRFASPAYQLVLRACLDRIGRHDFNSDNHAFRGAALGSFGEFGCADAYNLSERIDQVGVG